MRVEMPSINQGDRVRYANNINIPAYGSYTVEARFDGIDTSSNPVVRIYADIDNVVAETSEADNTLSVPLNSSNNNYYNNNYNNNCAWNNQNCNSNNTGNPNLTITSIETGKMIGGSFNNQTSFTYGERVTVRVNVRNTGGTFTNSWSTRLNYYDSYGVNRSVITDNERSINPGETYTIIYSLDSLTRGNANLNVNIDSNNNIYETNENDNTISSTVYIY
jgi:subtilase family serine protease